MSNLPDHDTISALAARPPENLKAREISHLQAGLLASAAVLAECEVYDIASGLMGRNPHGAHDLLLKMDEFGNAEFGYPMIRVMLMASAVVRMKEVEAKWDAEKAGGPADQAREAAFRADPGKFLPGATTSPIRLLRPSGFGLVEIDGQTWPWTYVSIDYERSDIAELRTFIAEGGYEPRGIVVGSAELADEVDLPEGWKLAVVELGGNTGGRVA